MTLLERLVPFMYCYRGSGMLANDYDQDVAELNAKVVERIVDEVAIEFAQWIRKETYYEHLTKEFIYKGGIYESEKELLQIFKKQKGL